MLPSGCLWVMSAVYGSPNCALEICSENSICYLRREFEHKPNWVHIFMLLHLPAWMIKWIIFLAIWRADVLKAVFIYLLNLHQQVRPKSVSPCHPSPSKDYSFGKQFQSKISPLSSDSHPTITPEWANSCTIHYRLFWWTFSWPLVWKRSWPVQILVKKASRGCW